MGGALQVWAGRAKSDSNLKHNVFFIVLNSDILDSKYEQAPKDPKAAVQ